MATIHNTKKRMPVILTPENERQWLNNEPVDNFALCDLELKAVVVG
jgi:putative SOS response-associated peptidase YedK